MVNEIMTVVIALIVAAITGGISTFATVTALRVHISYLKENLDRVDEKGTRAHSRIDDLEKINNRLKHIEHDIEEIAHEKENG